MTTFNVTRKLDFPVDKVWEIAGDFQKSPGPGIIVEVEDPGNPALGGVGAIRTITIGKVKVRERLESVDAPRSYTYKILSGAPMKDHLAKGEYIPRGAATEVRFTIEFTPKIFGIGWLVALITKKAVNRYIDEIEMTARQ
ncbi:SRPBCC family protein [candidate division CSSED10-310 bacterium]|uniref:SRPBCC family protein n=1 Tax=candidate division CSSED10-310 bacterium TaxID=2855610 RepID=A0ABV6YUJ8_UNCC1